MVAIEYTTPELLKSFRSQALNNGLITLGAGVFAKVSRILCPLTIDDKHLKEGIEIYTRSLQELI